jgi:hypothetical protein
MASQLLRLIPGLVALLPIAVLCSARQLRVTAAPCSLRIESMSPRRLHVELTSTPPGLYVDSVTAGEAQSKVVIWTPAVVAVADSVRTLHVVVMGMGAVRLVFDSMSPSPRRAAPLWGRDITLVRPPSGHFKPVPRAHLLPE